MKRGERGERGERGFTIVELMIALVVSSLLVGMILAIFSRMSLAYRGQQQIAGVQQVLAAARAAIELDAKQAGLGMAQGFMYNDGQLHQPVSIINNRLGLGPDQIAFFYADPTTQAAVTVSTPWPSPSPSLTVPVDSSVGFAIDNMAVISTADLTMSGLNASDGNIAKYSACVVQITGLSTNSITFANVAYCTGLPPPSATTMIYKFVARGYRIDTTRPALGPLQLSENGGLLGVADTWSDLAYGFTDLQTSLQAYDSLYEPGDSPDLDTDAFRDWYSADLQVTLTEPRNLGFARLNPPDGLLQASISLVARTDRNVEGIATAATPTLIDAANPNHNTLGDRPSFALPSATDPALQGSQIYRYTTFQVDFRNLGVGR